MINSFVKSFGPKFQLTRYKDENQVETFTPRFSAYFDVAFGEDSYIFLDEDHRLRCNLDRISLSTDEEMLLCALFKYAVVSAKDNYEDCEIGDDGVTLTISYQGKCASRWIMEVGNCMDFVDILKKLGTINHDEDMTFESLTPDIIALTDRFKSLCTGE